MAVTRLRAKKPKLDRMDAPREVHLMMSSDQRQVLETFLFAGEEVQTVAMAGPRFTGKTHTGAHCLGYRALMYPGTRHLALRTVQDAADLNMGEELKAAFFRPHDIKLGSRRRNEVQYLEAENRFVLQNDSMIQLGFCRAPRDWEKHLGVQWDTEWLEQAEQFTEYAYSRLSGSNRASTSTPCCPRRLLTFNPGGIGAEWIERRIVDPCTRDRRTVFVEAHIRNSMATLERDPSYVLRSLMSITDPILRAQWLDGKWDAKSGIFFRLLPMIDGVPGTIQEMRVPYWADWYCGVDWGDSSPFACMYVAHWEDKAGKRHLHVGGEVYQAGLELDQQAERALEKEKDLNRNNPFMHKVKIRMAGWETGKSLEGESTEQTRSKASVWQKHGFITRPSYRYSRSSGWSLIKYLIRRRILTIDPDCMALIKEFKTAVRKDYAEDVDDKRCADHALDALRHITVYLFGLDYREQEVDEWAGVT